MTKSLKAPTIVGLSAIFVIALLILLPLFGGQGIKVDSPVAAMQAASTPTPTPTVSTSCEAEFTQQALNNAGNKVDADFEKDYVAATAADAANLPEAARGLLLKKAGNNAQFLAIRAHEFGLFEDPNKWESLVKDGCLSKEGQKLHAQYEGVLTAKGTTIIEAVAPVNGINSGIHDGTFGLADSAGIYGDLRAIKITLKDGTSVYILIRCANGVHPTNPGLPEVPTDNPEPVCPWNPDLPPGDPNCLQPKSSNPAEWPYIENKPPVSVDTETGTGPAPVETSRPGGGGVIDTPTTPPGEESGVTAPGAEPPAPDRENPPAPEVTQPPAPPGDPGGF